MVFVRQQLLALVDVVQMSDRLRIGADVRDCGYSTVGSFPRDASDGIWRAGRVMFLGRGRVENRGRSPANSPEGLRPFLKLASGSSNVCSLAEGRIFGLY